MELMTALFTVGQGMVNTIMGASGLSALTDTTLPNEMVTIIEDVSFLDGIPLWAVTLLGSLFIWMLSLVMILTVYSRFFKLYMATAIASAPPALSDPSLAAATIVWNYVGEILFNMLVLVGAIKMSDRLIRELMGLG